MYFNGIHTDSYSINQFLSLVGWTFQGGLGGTTGGRLYGFGADQVLQLEMVLPNGQHVKFGPTEWEVSEGYDVPKTTTVAGVCRTNPDEMDEDNWLWGDCSEDINFDDLWFAVRGGGGGTWGVILSMHLQLHEHLPLERLFMNLEECINEDELEPSQLQSLVNAYQEFEIKAMFDPESINVTEGESNACGWPTGDAFYSCYGEGSAKVFETAWKKYLESISQRLIDDGVPVDQVDASLNCTGSVIQSFDSYADLVLSMTPIPGKIPDSPQPMITSTTATSSNIIIPKKWVLENIETAVTYFPPAPSGYKAFAGRSTAATSDQANSLSRAHRDGAYMMFIDHNLVGDDFFTYLFPEMFDTSDTTNFPGFIGSNHAGPNTRGPLKEDWTKACPLDWTAEERDEKCELLL